MTILGTISAILLAALPCIAAQDSARRTHAQDFSTQGLDSAGRLIWQLSGESADFRGSVTDLKDANARIVNLKNIETVIHTTAGKKFTLTSTSCQVLLALVHDGIEFVQLGIVPGGDEAALPLDPVKGPWYRWEDLKALVSERFQRP